MTKERINITIEKEILEKAKKHMPNLSAFVEECLKHYMGLVNGTHPVANDKEMLDKIGKLQVEFYMRNQNFDIHESMKNAEKFKKDKAWRFLWNDYRIRLIPNESLMETAVEVLGIDAEEMEEILDLTFVNRSEVDTNYWENVFESYCENNES